MNLLRYLLTYLLYNYKDRKKMIMASSTEEIFSSSEQGTLAFSTTIYKIPYLFNDDGLKFKK